jgi:hypothetical protein
MADVARLAGVGEFIPSKALKYREDAERAMREFENAGLDGVLVVMHGAQDTANAMVRAGQKFCVLTSPASSSSRSEPGRGRPQAVPGNGHNRD